MSGSNQCPSSCKIKCT